MVRFTPFYIFLLVVHMTYYESLCEEYIEIDGITVLKSDYEKARQLEEEAMKNMKQFSEMDIEQKLEEKESVDVAKNLPNPCHVCRLFVEDLMRYFEENATLANFTKNNQNIFLYNEHFAYEAFEEVCEQMKDYRVTRIEQFRYVKEPSLLRQVFNEYQKDSKAKQWMYNIPEHDIDDPTGEIRRIKSQCYVLKRTHRLALLDWFENNQREPLISWFCKERFLKHEEKDCLTEKKLQAKQSSLENESKKRHQEL